MYFLFFWWGFNLNGLPTQSGSVNAYLSGLESKRGLKEEARVMWEGKLGMAATPSVFVKRGA
jgi:hypothetical protein